MILSVLDIVTIRLYPIYLLIQKMVKIYCSKIQDFSIISHLFLDLFSFWKRLLFSPHTIKYRYMLIYEQIHLDLFHHKRTIILALERSP